MKLDLNVLSDNEVISTSSSNKMKLSEGSQSIIFRMFSKNIYSNPIGSVVREITSNCFDSHVEAKVNTPVIIRLTHDNDSDTFYISFIDSGMGMSPERFNNIYSTFFESTKRDTDEMIGAFGLGSKTPLAYKRITGEGEGEYDNSFFVNTIYNGIKYYYNIYEGQESPEYSLLFKENTKEHNGTEVRIPIRKKDLHTFAKEIRNQLYYFDNIIFEGFENHSNVTNDYKIYEGKNFYYRGDDVDNRLHICLGKVYYPINYNVLGLSEYDHSIPLAIKIPIGKINVTVSRENIDYSEETIKYLKSRINDVKQELTDRLTEQLKNVVSLNDYFLNKKVENLKLGDDVLINIDGFIDTKNLTFPNFKFMAYTGFINGYSFEKLFNVRRYGKKELINRHNDAFDSFTYTNAYNSLIDCNNVYYCEDKTNINNKRVLFGYLRDLKTRFYLITKHNVNNIDVTTKDGDQIPATILEEIQNEYLDIIHNTSHNLLNVEIPETFKLNYGKRKTINDELKKTTIPYKSDGVHNDRAKLSEFMNFKGKIIYSSHEDRSIIEDYSRMFKLIYGSKYVTSHPVKYTPYQNIMFISVSNVNLKHFKKLDNAYHHSKFKKMYVRKSTKELYVKAYWVDKIKYEFYNNIDSFYFNDLMEDISNKYYRRFQTIKNFMESVDVTAKDNIYYRSKSICKFLDINEETKTKEVNNVLNTIEKLKNFIEKNKNVGKYINFTTSYLNNNEEAKDMYIKLYKSIMDLR